MSTFWMNAGKFVTLLHIFFLNNSQIFGRRLGLFKYCIKKLVAKKKLFKVVSATFLLVCIACLKESPCETRNNVFFVSL